LRKGVIMKTSYRTHTCGELRLINVGQEVKLIGWVKSVRTHGGVVFIDLRDRYGVTQIVTNDSFFREITKESVISVIGTVKERTSKNPNLPTGDIEVHAKKISILSKAHKIPLDLSEETTSSDDVRLKYRYLDLRRNIMQKNIILRHKIVKYIRDFLNDKAFLEIETPILSKSTPEGARDYLVPSRKFPGKFYALPQSPQQYKQLLMIAGLDRYFQIARCFRDEDLRADRQPEFTQLDLEMSFVNQDNVLSLFEELMIYVFAKLGIKLKTPFLRLSCKEALERFGTDKPDLRFGLQITDVTDVFKKSSFRVFVDEINSGGVVKCINFKFARLSNKQIKKLEELVKKKGAKGLAYLKYDNEVSGSLSKFWNEISDDLEEKIPVDRGDVLFFVADKWKTACESLGQLRLALFELVKETPELKKAYEKHKFIEEGFKFLWVVDFPLFSWSEEEQRFVSEHHPFTMPSQDFVDILKDSAKRKEWTNKLDKVMSQSYDLVLNGFELASGSIRIHDSELQKAIFSILGLSDEDISAKFGHMIEAFKYGCPPHGGIALGLDRLVAIVAQADSIREVIAFPKNKNAFGPLESTPSKVSEQQLKELHLKPDTKMND